MKRRLKGLGVILVAASTLLASACGAGGHKKTAGGGTLTISNASGGLWTCGFNPFNSSVNFLVTGNVYEPLVFVNALQDQKVTPWLATAWQWSNGNKTITFTIRDGVKWNDGKPMTAADVLFTFNLLKKYPAIDINSIWQVINDVSQQGSNQIVINFKTAAVPYLFYVGDQLPILPEHIWSTVGDPAHFNNPHPVGTGAYVINPCTPQNVTYTANKSYWQPGLPKISKVLYPAFTDNGPANTYLATGQAQWGSQFIPNINTFYVKRSASHHYWNPPVAQVTLFPNLKTSPLDDVAVRKAIAYAVDRPKAAQIAEDGQVPAGNQVGVVDTYKSWIDPAAKALDDYTFNVAKADQTLDAAGYKKGSDGIYVSPKGKKLSFTVINQSGYSDWVAAMETIKQSLKSAGIEINVSNLSSDAYFQKLYNGQFDLAYYAEQNVGPSPYYELRDWLYSSGTAPIGQAATTNMERYSDPATDKLFDDFAATSDPAQQKQLIAQIEQIVVKDIPVIPVTQQPDWYQYDTSTFTGWPTQSNPYALPAAFQYPDMGQVLLHLQPK